MTELTAFLMVLMLTVELGLAIAFAAAWLAARQAGEKRHASLTRRHSGGRPMPPFAGSSELGGWQRNHDANPPIATT